MVLFNSSRVLSSMVLALALGKSAAGKGSPKWWVPPSDFDLPECPGEIEERHYNIDVQVTNLPENCTDEQLVVVGWLIEDAIQDMEESMPEYQVSLIVVFDDFTQLLVYVSFSPTSHATTGRRLDYRPMPPSRVYGRGWCPISNPR